MSYKSLMVYADEGLDSDTRITLACDLARVFEAHLIGVSGSAPVPPPVGDPYLGGAMMGEALTLYRDLAEGNVTRAEARFRELSDDRIAGSEWRGRIGFPAELVIEQARAADLLILGRRDDRAPFYGPDPADVLMAAGRPVLVVPPAAPRTPVGWPAVIAWSDSREARRAVAAAVPMLRQTGTVHILEVCDDEPTDEVRTRLDDVVAWLKRHGVAADCAVRPRGGQSHGDAILGFAAETSAGLIVAGGYGHARLREWAMGGVTRTLLDDSPVCLLLSH
ncbi:universal stress protein [uncultured Brevundimonas sp.]|uniref:universal stress protein n=1 Tax=uncultured Brevundimonas sp. TaxID=213418 RepID=UPI0030EE3308|tara:strand:+ start:10626 stop:11459 length:834 start_codon:yes stop_codon:yes gene_type:complete